MTAYPPPLYSFTGLNFNPTIFETTQTTSTGSGFTQAQADLLYLQKTTPDTAVVTETFSDGIITTFIDNTTNLTIGNPFYSTNIDGDVFIQHPVAYPDNTKKVATTSYVTSAINALSSIYITAAQSAANITAVITTLLSSNNTWTATNTFSNGIITTFIDNTTNLTIGNLGYSTIIDGDVFILNPVSYPDNTKKVATTSYVTSAITTLKGATNSWTGANSFSQAITISSIETPTLNANLSIGSVSQPTNIYLGGSSTTTTTYKLITNAVECPSGGNLALGQTTVGYIYFGGNNNDTYFSSANNYGNNFYSPIFDNLTGSLFIGNMNKTTYLDGANVYVNNSSPTYPNNTTLVATTAFVTSAISSLSSIYQTASQVTTAITSYGYQTAAQVTTAITSYGYQTATQVTTSINSAITTLKGATNSWTGSNSFSQAITIPKLAFTSGNLTTAFFFQSGTGNVSTIPATTVVSITVNYPSTFPTGIYGVVVSNNSASGNGPKCIMSCTSPGTVSFTLNVYNTTASSIGTVAYSYLAYGY